MRSRAISSIRVPLRFMPTAQASTLSSILMVSDDSTSDISASHFEGAYGDSHVLLESPLRDGIKITETFVIDNEYI